MKKKARDVFRTEKESEYILGIGEDMVDDEENGVNMINSNDSVHSEDPTPPADNEDEELLIEEEDEDEELLIEEEELPFYLELIKGFNSKAMKKSRKREFEKAKRKRKVIELVEGGDVIFQRAGKGTIEIRAREDSLEPEEPEINPGPDEVLEDLKPVVITCINPVEYPDAGAKLPECTTCHIIFKTVAEFKKHMNKDHKDLLHSCDVCLKRFPTPVKLRQHKRNHGPKTHICPVCGAGFPFEAGLRRHALVHSKERPFPCTSCSASFTQENHLKRHAVMHSADKSFECITCGKKFGYKFGLVRHCRFFGHVS